jgi:uncharacterized protein (DUF1499 family)
MDIIADLLGGITGLASNLWPKPQEKPGLVNGRLRACPGTPNCVCSESADPLDRIEPLTFQGAPETAWETLRIVVTDLGGTVRSEEKDYLWTTFQVPVLGFTDDVEFRLDASNRTIHVRSASRLGYSDLGVNRGRVEQLRTAFGRAGHH